MQAQESATMQIHPVSYAAQPQGLQAVPQQTYPTATKQEHVYYQAHAQFNPELANGQQAFT